MEVATVLFLYCDVYPSETASENGRAGLDFILRELIGSLEVWKMEADLKCQFAVSGGGFLATTTYVYLLLSHLKQ